MIFARLCDFRPLNHGKLVELDHPTRLPDAILDLPRRLPADLDPALARIKHFQVDVIAERDAGVRGRYPSQLEEVVTQGGIG